MTEPTKATYTRQDAALVIAFLLGAILIMPLFASLLQGLGTVLPAPFSDFLPGPEADVERYPRAWYASPDGAEDHSVLAQELFSTWAIPFEVLSVLLLVALIGAIAVAARHPDAEGGDL